MESEIITLKFMGAEEKKMRVNRIIGNLCKFPKKDNNDWHFI